MNRFIIPVLLRLFLSHFSIAQTIDLDSMKMQLRLTEDDAYTVNLLIDIAKQKYWEFPDSALKYANKAIILSEEKKFLGGEASAHRLMGLAHSLLGNHVEAITSFEAGIIAFREAHDKLGESKMLNNIGYVYSNEGLNERAIFYYLRAIRLTEELKDSLGLSMLYSNIGIAYAEDESTYDSALKYFNHALVLEEEQNNIEMVGWTAWTMGKVYLNKRLFDSAQYYFQRSLVVFNNTDQISNIFNYIGELHFKKGDYDSAIIYQNKAVEAAYKFDSKADLIISTLGIAETYRKMARSSEAIKAYKKVESLVGSARDFKEVIKEAYAGLTNLYKDLHDYKNAYHYQNLLNVVTDSLTITSSNFKQGIKELKWYNAEKEYVLRQDILEGDVQMATLVRNYSFFVGGLLLLIVAGIVFQFRSVKKKNKIIADGKKKSDDLLLNILPEETANELMTSGHVNPRKYALSTVLFTDFKEFAKIVDSVSPNVLVKSLDYYFQEFDRICAVHNLEKIKTIGDAYMCVGGIPTPNDKNPVDVLNAAVAMLKFVLKPPPDGIEKFEIRIGIHTGPIIAGIVGIKKFQYDVWGTTVNVASLMEANSEPQKINISQNTYEYVKYDFNCTHRGQIEVKHGKKMDMYFVEV